MSLGIDDPVTRDAFRSDSEYYLGLAQQVSDMMVAVLLVSYINVLSIKNSLLHLISQCA